jgi:MoaA/NifB/PqqE/SkfB family radical SAM enzyme
MSTDRILRMLEEAARLNFAAYLAWGGEPFMRHDLMDILRHARRLGLYTSLVTNGTFLAEKAKDVARTVDLTLVSLDHFSSYHSEMRGLDGVFEMAKEGIVKLKKAGGRAAVNCVLSRLNMDSVRGMCELASALRVKVAFDPMEVFPGINEEYALSRVERSVLFSEILELKREGYPILNSHDYIQHLISPQAYSCAQPRVFTVVSENGVIAPFWCRKNSQPLGDLREQSLGSILCSDRYEEFVERVKGCNLCINSVTAESSLFYSATRFLANCFGTHNPIVRFIADYSL